MITFNCPHCQQSISTDQSDAGLAAACPACSRDIEVPSADNSIQESPVSAVPPDPERSPEKTKTGGAETPDKVPNSPAFRDRVKSLAAAGWSEVKRNSKIAAIHAQIEKLKNVDLPMAHHSLGKSCYEGGFLEGELKERYLEISNLDSTIAEKGIEEVAGVEESKVATLQRIGKHTAKLSHARALKLKRQHLLIKLGNFVASTPGAEIGAMHLEPEFEAVREVGLKIERLKKEADQISPSIGNGVSTKTKTTVVLLVALSFLMVSFVIFTAFKGRYKGSPQDTRVPSVDIADPNNPTDPDAQFLLGLARLKGDGSIYSHADIGPLAQDYQEAAKWLRKSAEQGNDLAQVQLGYMYFNGEGFERNFEEAARWWRVAAENGSAFGQHQFGLLHQAGAGVEQSSVQAYMWFNLAASGEDDSIRPVAMKSRDHIARKMSREEIEEAQRLSREWKPR